MPWLVHVQTRDHNCSIPKPNLYIVIIKKFTHYHSRQARPGTLPASAGPSSAWFPPWPPLSGEESLSFLWDASVARLALAGRDGVRRGAAMAGGVDGAVLEGLAELILAELGPGGESGERGPAPRVLGAPVPRGSAAEMIAAAAVNGRWRLRFCFLFFYFLVCLGLVLLV
jgi:hypothetical protein